MRVKVLGFGVVLVISAAVQVVGLKWSAADEPGGADSVAWQPEFHVVRVEVSDRAEIEFLAVWLDIWDVDPERGTLDAAVHSEGFEILREFGFHFEIDAKATVKYHRAPESLKGQAEGIPGYPCYRTVEETLATGAALAAAHPELAEWIDIGDSWEKTRPGGNPGYDLMVLRLTNTANGIPSAEKPRLWVMGSTHAREYTTAETVTRFGEHLLAEYGADPDVTWLLDHHEVHLLLVTNPDGRKHAEAGISWRKNTNEAYCGATSTFRGRRSQPQLRLRLGLLRRFEQL